MKNFEFDIGDPVYIVDATPPLFGKVIDCSHSEHGPAYVVLFNNRETRVYLEQELKLA